MKNYDKIRSLRISDKVWKRLKQERKKSKLSWDRYLRNLLK